MTITITVETGAIVTGANSYRSLAELKDYFRAHPYGAAVLARDDETLKAGLVQARRVIDSCGAWRGQRRQWDQPCEWPRYGLWPGSAGDTGQENITLALPAYDGGEMVPANKVPARVGDAQCELVRFLLRSDRDVAADGPALASIKVDVVEKTFQDGAKRPIVPEIVQRLIEPFVVSLDDDGPIGGAASSGSYFVRRA